MTPQTAHRLQSLLKRLKSGQMSRRQFLRTASAAGFGALLGGAMGRPTPAVAQIDPDALRPSQAGLDWAREVSAPLRGTTIRFATESTPPSVALKTHLAQHFTEATGIEVVIEVAPLEEVLEKLVASIATKSSDLDLYYIDQSWAAFAATEVLDPRETLADMPDLAMPGYAPDDFMPELVTGISAFKDRWVGVPYDVPIFVTHFRRDIYDKFGFSAPTGLEDYYEMSKAITDAMGPDVYGTTGQMKFGHLALEADWTAWLWGHGGSIFGADGRFAGNDEAGIAAMDYWKRLWKTMPPEVLDWTWDGQGQSVAQGRAASMVSWAEWFPYISTNSESRVRGLVEVAACPRPKALRSPGDTAYGEVPGIARQGGSSLAVSRYSSNKLAAWIFMQWATSADTQTLITLLSGGTAPTRASVYKEDRLQPYLDPVTGTMRHLSVIEETIANDMGSEPDLETWAELANFTIPVHLGRYFKGQYDSAPAMLNALAETVDTLTGAA